MAPTKADNEKIVQAMKGQAEARIQKREIPSISQTVIDVAVGRPPSAKERATGGIGVSRPAPKPEPIRTRKPRVAKVAPAKAVKVSKPKPEPKVRKTTVLPDPVDNARLIRMRAKWSAQREEVRAARAEEKYGEQSPEAVAARALVDEAWASEREAYAAYSLLLEKKRLAGKIGAENADEAVAS